MPLYNSNPGSAYQNAVGAMNNASATMQRQQTGQTTTRKYTPPEKTLGGGLKNAFGGALAGFDLSNRLGFGGMGGPAWGPGSVFSNETGRYVLKNGMYYGVDAAGNVVAAAPQTFLGGEAAGLGAGGALAAGGEAAGLGFTGGAAIPVAGEGIAAGTMLANPFYGSAAGSGLAALGGGTGATALGATGGTAMGAGMGTMAGAGMGTAAGTGLGTAAGATAGGMAGGAATGATAGSVVPGLGTMIGAGVGALIGLAGYYL